MAEESAKQAAELTTLDKILTEGKMVRDESQKSYAKDLIGEFVNQVLDQGMTIGDYEFSRNPQDIALLEKLSNVAASAHAPFVSAASPKLFDMDSFTELGKPRDLAKLFESTELIKWRSFRDTEDSRYVTLVMPHVLLRLPYGPKTKPVDEFAFVEEVNGKDHAKYLWGNAA